MRGLELRYERSYKPHEVGLETPLLFERPPLYLRFLSKAQDFAMEVSNLQTSLERQTIEARVSTERYDRVIVPVWMIEGQLPNGFFAGVLRPSPRHHPDQIDFAKDRSVFHFYLEQEDLLAVGITVNGFLNYRDPFRPKSLTAIVTQIDERKRKEEITPEFEVNLALLFDSSPDELLNIYFLDLM